ncbi:MAG: hypothetical protein LBT10_04425 [Methanobrevibacter sp.]|jgi:metal-responsive CopG/Arc/MetJ family transcriptional regulator|nr:hypothetical protein [Methanobrevibacter sp.]
MTTSTITIKIDTNLLKSINKIAKTKGTTGNYIINNMIKKALKNTETIEEKIKRLSNGKITMANAEKYNPDPEKFLKMAGIIETKKPFDTGKALNEIRKMEY